MLQKYSERLWSYVCMESLIERLIAFER